MSTMSSHHETLTDGVGKCSKPMWFGYGGDAGFCDEPAYGRQEPGQRRSGEWGAGWENGRWYSGGVFTAKFCPGLACYAHGGPKERAAEVAERIKGK